MLSFPVKKGTGSELTISSPKRTGRARDVHLRLQRSARQTPRLTGFTLIELLVVIAIIGLLIALVTAVASKAIGQQKTRNTQQIMQNVMLALEQFATEDPLGKVYADSFGNYPPYQLANCRERDSVAKALEYVPPAPSGGVSNNNLLSDRLARDLGCESAGDKDRWVVIGPEVNPPPSGYPDGHDDARALYTYLKLFSPDSLRLIPDEYSKPLYPQLPAIDRSYVNSQGNGASQGTLGAEDVLAIHDAWGVPLDYMLYVKVEWGLIKNPITGAQRTGYRVVERKPALRSLGIEREVYDAVVSAALTPSDRDFDSSKWLFSESLSIPVAGLADYDTGELDSNGWARAVGLAEDYAYRPADDVEEP